MKPKPEIVAAMELLLTQQIIARILDRTFSGPSRVTILRRAVAIGLDWLEEKDRAFGRKLMQQAPSVPMRRNR
jgi:hypothetical protein